MTARPFSPETLADRWDCSAEKVRLMCRNGELASFRLGNKMRKWCDEAGLKHCSMHGLRKATSRMLAETGATDAEGQAITGHKKAATFQKYRAKANRAALADRAFSNLEAIESFQPKEIGGKSDA